MMREEKNGERRDGVERKEGQEGGGKERGTE